MAIKKAAVSGFSRLFLLCIHTHSFFTHSFSFFIQKHFSFCFGLLLYILLNIYHTTY